MMFNLLILVTIQVSLTSCETVTITRAVDSEHELEHYQGGLPHDSPPKDKYNGAHCLEEHAERADPTVEIELEQHEFEERQNITQNLLNHIVANDILGMHEDRPLYVADLDDIIYRIKKMHDHIPRVHAYYALKANEDTIVAKLIASFGLGFDVASLSEIDQVLSMGVSAEKIIFANPFKTVYQLQYAKDRGVHYMTYDSEYEIRNIAKTFPEAKPLLRIKVKDDGAMMKLGDKFGCFENQIEKLLKLSLELNCPAVGIAFHVGGRQKNPDTYMAGIASARAACDVGSKLGLNFTVLDIGGGYLGSGDLEDPKDPFYQIAAAVDKELDQVFSQKDFPNLKIISEPGRYYMESAFFLVTEIIGKKIIESTGERWYYINDGLYQSFLNNAIEFDFQKTLEPYCGGYIQERESHPSTVWGQSCSSHDAIVYNLTLPEMEVGEHFVSRDFGAYTVNFRTEFNGFEPPKVIYAIGKHNKHYLGL